MATGTPPSPYLEEDYEAIEAAVMETGRGRWFLSEFAKRNRHSDTNMLLDAIQKLGRSMQRERSVPDIDRVRLDLADMHDAIVRTKLEIQQIKHESDDGNRFTIASDELDAIVTQTETATQNILNNAEKIQEVAWNLREEGAGEDFCDQIDALSTEIFMACSFQDLTGQRTQKVVQVLRYLESRINAMMEIWTLEDIEVDIRTEDNQDKPAVEQPAPIEDEALKDNRPDAHLLNGPQLDGKGVCQDAVDALMGEDSPSFKADETQETSPQTSMDQEDISNIDFDTIEVDEVVAQESEFDETDFDADTAVEPEQQEDEDTSSEEDEINWEMDSADEAVSAAQLAIDESVNKASTVPDIDESDDDPLKELSQGDRLALFN
ncbi:MAG: protein phosphatase CheZ [Stappiaceae bacterium]